MNLPEKYLENMKELLGTDFDAYIESFNDSRLYGLRVNTMKISVEDFLKICPFKLTPIPWIENGFYYSEDDKPAKHPYYFAGLYYIQEPSAMTPANVLPVEEGDIVFDMCAAPGGKSTELGAKLNGSGLLVTNDISNSRAKALLKNVEVFGIPNVYVVSEDPKNIQPGFNEFFDKILIDAPCSGEGMFRKDNKLIKSWEKTGPEFYAKIQRDIILTGADMLKPGGKMLYSTCTFSKLEDEETVRHLLINRPDMHLIDIKHYDGFSSGFTYDDELKNMHLEKTVRIFPHKMEGEGHFVALFEKKSDGETPFKGHGIIHKQKNTKLATELEDFLGKLNKDTVNFDIENAKDNIMIKDNYVYLCSPYMPGQKGMRIMRTGLLLGELKKNRFEPSQALAMVLKMSDYPDVINLPASDERVIKYLKGETLDLPEFDGKTGDGWNLFCVDGYPLGWGKFKNGSLKNKYLAGWRWQ